MSFWQTTGETERDALFEEQYVAIIAEQSKDLRTGSSEVFLQLFQRFQSLIQRLLPALEVHIRHIERLQLIVELLGLRKRCYGAVQVQLDARTLLLQRTFVAQQAACGQTQAEIECQRGGKQIAGRHQRVQRRYGQVQQAARLRGAQILLNRIAA